MNEIIGFFINPEESMNVLLNESTNHKWREGILKWLLVAILVGLLSMIAYKLSGAGLEIVQGTYYDTLMNTMFGENGNEGVMWLTLSVITILETFIIACIRTACWIILLYAISTLLKDEISFYQIVLMSIFCILTWITSQVFSSIASIIGFISPMQVINDMLQGLGIILGYWHIVIFIIGYSIATGCTFLKSGVIILGLQAVLWGISVLVPVLGVVLG